MMDSILTGVRRVFTKMEPVTLQRTIASRNSPTDSDRSYRDHTVMFVRRIFIMGESTNQGSEGSLSIVAYIGRECALYQAS